MKIKKGYILKQVSNHYIVIPSLETSVNFNGVMTLNSSGKLLFEALVNDYHNVDSLVKLLTNEYDVDIKLATKDVNDFITKLKKHELIEFKS